MEYVLNYMELHEIDVTPNGASRTWKRLAEGITSADPSNNDNVDQTAYLNGNGYGSSDVIGAQMTIAFSGHRVVGDAAQDYIASVQRTLGNGRKTNYRFTDAQGNQVSGACTIANVDFGGGDANAKTEIAFEIHLNGKPLESPTTEAPALTVTVGKGTASGTTKATATPGAGNSLVYILAAQTFGTAYANQFLNSGIAYTSESDIAATAGQFLTVFEVDANGRVVKYAEQQLETSDINIKA